MTTALLLIIALLTAAAAALMIASLRRRDGLQALTAMTLMMIAAIPASVFASLTG